jgi:hypothetical protein
MRWVFAAALLAMAGFQSEAHAQTAWWQPSEFRAGLAAHDTKPISSGREAGAALNGELFLSPIFGTETGRVSLRPSIGGTASLSGDTSYGFVDLTAEVSPFDPIFFDLGGGVAVHDGYDHPGPADRKDLGSRVLFHVAADVGARLTDHFGLSVYFDHLSNAGLARHNEGLETIGLRGSWRF